MIIRNIRRLILSAIVLVFLAWSNQVSGYINAFTEGIGGSNTFTTRNRAFTFDEIPTKGRDIAAMERQFRSFLNENPDTADTVLYRTFKPNLLKFWNWHTYATHERYRYKYMRSERKLDQGTEIKM